MEAARSRFSLASTRSTSWVSSDICFPFQLLGGRRRHLAVGHHPLHGQRRPARHDLAGPEGQPCAGRDSLRGAAADMPSLGINGRLVGGGYLGTSGVVPRDSIILAEIFVVPLLP